MPVIRRTEESYVCKVFKHPRDIPKGNKGSIVLRSSPVFETWEEVWEFAASEVRQWPESGPRGTRVELLDMEELKNIHRGINSTLCAVAYYLDKNGLSDRTADNVAVFIDHAWWFTKEEVPEAGGQ